jgi:hypothetical protein
MPLGNWNLEWLDHNTQRSYPLAAGATKQDVSRSFFLPDDFLAALDLSIPTAMNARSNQFFFRQIGVFSSGVQLLIAYDNGSEVEDVATALIPVFNGRNKTISLGGIDPYDDVTGKLVVGKLDSILQQPAGLFTFELADTAIESQAIRPQIRGLTSLRVTGANGNTSSRYYGDIELVAGSNFQLSLVDTPTVTRIVFSALSGEGTVEDCVCEGAAADTPCIKTINGITPSADGNFSLFGDDCLTTQTATNGLSFEDRCCAPCCGCEELEQITRALEQFSAQREALSLFANNLAAEVTAFDSTVLGSRLGDRRCLTCE